MKTLNIKLKLKSENDYKIFEKMIYAIIDQMQGDLNQADEDDDYSEEEITLEQFQDILKQIQKQK